MPAENWGAYRLLTARSAVPIAAGEHLAGHGEFTSYVTDGLCSVLQPDSALAGGITEVARACDMAAEHRVPVTLHSLAELHVHLAVAKSAVIYVEHFPILGHLITEPLDQRDGAVSPTSRPGHGIKWDRDALAACTLPV